MDDAVVRLKLLLTNGLTTPFMEAKKNFNGGIDQMNNKLSDFKKTQKDTFKGMADEIPGMGRAISLMTNPLTLAAAGIAAIGTGFYQATKMANSWEEGLANVNVTAQLSRKELRGLSDQLLEIGARNSVPMEDIPNAFEKIISNNLSVSDALKVLEPTIRMAKAGFADIETTARAGVTVMKASGESITTVYDVLAAVKNKGNAGFKDIAQYLPKIIAPARQAGLALYETAGAWAYLTGTQSSERSTTLMENGLKVLRDIDRVKAFKKMGIDIYNTQTGKIKPFVDIIDKLAQKTKNLTDLGRTRFFSKLGMDSEAVSLFASLTQNAKELRTTMDFVRDSAGQANTAFENAKTPLDDWRTTLNALKKDMIGIGQAILPHLATLGKWVKEQIDILGYSFRSLKENIGFNEKNGGNSLKDWYNKKLATVNSQKEYDDLQREMKVISYKSKEKMNLSTNAENAYSPALLSNGWLENAVNFGLTSYNWITKPLFGYEMEKPLGFRGLKEQKLASTNYGSARYRGEHNAAEAIIKTAPKDWKRAKGISDKPVPKDNANQLVTPPPIKDTTDHIAGTAKQIQNITVNIDSFNKGGINTQNTSLQKMDASQIEEWFTQSMLRTIRNLEMSYS